jgi:hypothetical protein
MHDDANFLFRICHAFKEFVTLFEEPNAALIQIKPLTAADTGDERKGGKTVSSPEVVFGRPHEDRLGARRALS